MSWWRFRHDCRIVLHHGTRSFVLTVPRAAESNFNGQLRPRPQLRGTRTGVSGGRRTESGAYLDFAIIRNQVGKFQGIGVPDEYHRQGWATDMVKALLNHYPGIHFYNSSLNEMSGPLFMKLQAELPRRIAPIRVGPSRTRNWIQRYWVGARASTRV
jgi:hypothetical protein